MLLSVNGSCMTRSPCRDIAGSPSSGLLLGTHCSSLLGHIRFKRNIYSQPGNESKTHATPQTCRCLSPLGRDLVRSIPRCKWESPGISPTGLFRPSASGQLTMPNVCSPYAQSRGFSTPAMAATTNRDLQGFVPFFFSFFFVMVLPFEVPLPQEKKKKTTCKEWSLIIPMNGSCSFPGGKRRA